MSVPDPLNDVRKRVKEVLKVLGPEYRDVIEWLRRCGASFVYSDSDSMMISFRCADRDPEAAKMLARFVEMLNTVIQSIYGEAYRMDLEDELAEKLKRGEPPVFDVMVVAKSKKGTKPAGKTYILGDVEEFEFKGGLYKERTIECVEKVREELVTRVVAERWSYERLVNEVRKIIESAPVPELFISRSLSLDMRREKGRGRGSAFKRISRVEHYVRFVRAAQLFRESKYVRIMRRGACAESMGEVCGTVVIDARIFMEIPAVDAKYLPFTRGVKRSRFWLLAEVLRERGGLEEPAAKIFDCKCADPGFREGFYIFSADCRLKTVTRRELNEAAMEVAKTFIDTVWRTVLSTLGTGPLLRFVPEEGGSELSEGGSEEGDEV